MTKQKISIIIPVHNAENYLDQCLNSIVTQTYDNLEIICIDDASVDASLSILQKFCQHDKRIQIFPQKSHIGAGKARNLGLTKASGDFILFLDCDGFFEKEMVMKMYNQIVADNSDIVVCEYFIFDHQKQKDIKHNDTLSRNITSSPFAPRYYGKKLFLYIDGCPWNKMFRAPLIKKHHILFEDLTSCNDITFVYTMLSLAHSVSVLKQPLIHYRTNQTTNISSIRGRNAENGFYAINRLKDNLSNLGLYPLFEETFLLKSKGVFLNELSYCSSQKRQELINLAPNILSDDLNKIFFDALDSIIPKTQRIKLFGYIPLITITDKKSKKIIKICGIPLIKVKKAKSNTKIYFYKILLIQIGVK